MKRFVIVGPETFRRKTERVPPSNRRRRYPPPRKYPINVNRQTISSSNESVSTNETPNSSSIKAANNGEAEY